MNKVIKKVYNKANTAATKIIGLIYKYFYITIVISLILAIRILIIFILAIIYLLRFFAINLIKNKNFSF